MTLGYGRGVRIQNRIYIWVVIMLLFAEAQSVIQIGTAESILGIVALLVSVGVAWGSLNTSVKNIKGDLDKNIKPDLKGVRDRLSTLEGKTSNLFASASPIKLTPRGEDMLHDSGLKQYIDDNYKLLTDACGESRSMDNPYDVQQSAFGFFDDYQFPGDISNKLKTYAFNAGISMDSLRRVGAIYFRDKCLEELGFTPEDVDGHDPHRQQRNG